MCVQKVYSPPFTTSHIPVAIDGLDFLGVSMDLVFTAGTSNGAMQCIGVAIADSPTVEEDETFTVTLTTSSPVVTLGNDITTVTIIDNNNICKLYRVCFLTLYYALLSSFSSNLLH